MIEKVKSDLWTEDAMRKREVRQPEPPEQKPEEKKVSTPCDLRDEEPLNINPLWT